jgi:hypothetical protein
MKLDKQDDKIKRRSKVGNTKKASQKAKFNELNESWEDDMSSQDDENATNKKRNQLL